MSYGSSVDTLRAHAPVSWDRTRSILFGDSIGVTLFLAITAYLLVIWRAGTFFNDVGLFVPALERLADGHLSLGAPTDLDNGYPGMYYADGLVYARNYGQLAFSLPAYWIVTAIGGFAARALVVLAWSGLLFAVAARVGTRFDRRRTGLAIGTILAILALGANALTFKPFLESQFTIIALQLASMLAAAFTGTLIYRLLARRHGATVGVFAGAVTVFASPVGFWAPIPKRHAFTAFFVVLALYALDRSRNCDGNERPGQAGFRAIAYASAGLLTWIHAPEGFTLFLALALVDLPTAPRNDRRTLAIIAGTFAVSLGPFLVTNYLISGNPLEPPRFLRSYNGLDSVPSADGGAGATDGGASNGGGPSAGSGSGVDVGFRIENYVPSQFATLLRAGFLKYIEGVLIIGTEFDRLYTVFVRWGVQGYSPRNIFFGGGTNLSVLESFPLAIAVLIAPVQYAANTARTRLVRPTLDAADYLVVVFSFLLVSLYMFRLPVHVMVTVRYLHPIYPLLVYGMFRQAAVRDLVTGNVALSITSYLGTVVGGSLLAVSALIAFDVSKGAFFQSYGVIALAVAAVFGVSLVASLWDRRASSIGAFVFGFGAGLGTLFVLTTAFVVMHYGTSALPVFETISGEIRWLTITS